MPQYNWTNVSKVIKGEVNTVQTEFEHILGANLLGHLPRWFAGIGRVPTHT